MIPIVMNKLEQQGFFKRYPKAPAPLQVNKTCEFRIDYSSGLYTAFKCQIGLLGLVLTFATPMCCAIFEQKASIKPTAIEPHLQEKIKQMQNPPELLYYNKGL